MNQNIALLSRNIHVIFVRHLSNVHLRTFSGPFLYDSINFVWISEGVKIVIKNDFMYDQTSKTRKPESYYQKEV